MAEVLNLFPARVPIGRADDTGAVYMSDEFKRAMGALLLRVGGPLGASTDDLAIEEAQATVLAIGHAMAQTAADLQLQLADLMGQFAQLAELRKALAGLELASINVPPAPDWEHPGRIGAATPNSGKFTTLQATDKVQLNPAGKDVEIKPTGAQLVTIQPQQPGQIDNMELGKTAPAPARVTTLNKVTVTQPATGATLTLADGATLTVPGAGGALGSAAYQPSSAFAARSTTGLAPAATDAASTQTLVNSLRSILLSVGIGS